MDRSINVSGIFLIAAIAFGAHVEKPLGLVVISVTANAIGRLSRVSTIENAAHLFVIFERGVKFIDQERRRFGLYVSEQRSRRDIAGKGSTLREPIEQFE